METKYFIPTKSDRDQLWRLRVVASTEDELGVLTTQTGFLAFRDQEKANKAFEMFNNNVIEAVIGDQLQPGIFEVSYHKVEVEVEVA
jgi:hypothetical protein